MLMMNTKFARRKDPVVATNLPEPTRTEERLVVDKHGEQSPTSSEAAEAIVIQKRLEECFNIDSVDLKPSLAQRQDDRYHSFSKFLKRPNIRALNTGLTARVSRILENASRMSRIVQPNDDSEDDSVPGVLSMTVEQKWKLRKQSLKDEINLLKSRVSELEQTHGSSDHRSYKVDVPQIDLRKPGEGIKGLLTELTILRRDNYALRNLTDEELEIRNREVLEDLRTKVSQLEKENAQLQRKLNEHRDNHLLSKRPPTDILDLNNVKRMPLDISNIEKERVYQALDDEWKYSTSISRHGSSEPLQGPFERRRFINK
jgi:hypothetical protein